MGNQCRRSNIQQNQIRGSSKNVLLLKQSKIVYDIPNLQQNNSYPLIQKQSNEQVKKILSNNPELIKMFGGYLTELKNTSPNKFNDQKFRISNQKCYPLDRLYSKSPIRSNENRCKDLEQKYKQYTYLTAVFCFIADNPKIIPKILLNQLNSYGFYVLKLHPSIPSNSPMLVVVDDKIITENNDPKYSHILTFSPWVYLIEKAWAKLLGSYDRARGLSPQDAVQQIIGIPSYSFPIFQIEKFVSDGKIFNQNYIYLLTAKGTENPRGLYYHQVFYLVNVKTFGQNRFEFQLQCPYRDFKFQGQLNPYQQQNIVPTGTIKMSQNQIIENFEYLTVGYYKQEYQNFVYPLNFNIKNSQNRIYIKFSVQQQQQIAIRIIQYYQAYIVSSYYSYSPVYLKLFNFVTYEIISEGCLRSQGCVKSAHVFKNVMQKLKKGQYILSIQIEWIRPDILSSANLVFYSSQQLSRSIRQIQKSEGDGLYLKYIKNLFEQADKWQNLQYKVIRKDKSIYIYFKNIDIGLFKFAISFPQIQNLKPIDIIAQTVPLDFDKKILQLRLMRQQIKIIEFRKIDPNQDAALNAFRFILKN